ncbi:MAG: outer membrane beta-barrel family protein, partial [Leadbetterella sp.]|nr:outer membrane beta-barrel family protein [Leadbetterella sp.]
MEISYDIDSLNLVSGQVNINGNRNEGLGKQSSLLETGGTLAQQYRLLNTGEGHGNGRDLALNYQRGFKADKNRLLTFSYRYYGFENHQQNTIAISDRIQYELPDYRQLNNQRSSEQTLQADFVYPSRKLSVEAGVKAIFRKNESDFGYLNRVADSGEYIEADSLSNHYLNTQTIYGIYNTYRYKHKSWDIRGGFRVEQTLLDANFISTDSRVSQNYFNVIPTVALGRKLGGGNLSLAYTQRIQRPGIYQLNPFVDRTNPNFERTGNPDLRPAIANDINVSYGWAKKTSVNVVIGHVFIKNMIFPVLVYDPETGISRSSYDNVGRARLLPTFSLNVN